MPLPLYYNWRNLLRRRLSTALTFAVVAVVVMVLAVLLSFASGIRASLAATGSPRNLLVLKPGATAEGTSILWPEEVARLAQVPHAEVDSSGRPLASPELCVQTSIPRRTPDRAIANVAVRGVDDLAFEVHPEVRIMEGRSFAQGAMEIIVGRAAQERYHDTSVGDELQLGRLGNRLFKVVGVFEASGGALESEIWAPRTILSDAYTRRFVSSVAVRLTDSSHSREAVDYVKGPTVQLEAKTEPDYYKDLSRTTREIVALTTVLVAIMAIGAVFAVANTMFAAVDGRRREIAMLRTIGFSRGAIMAAFLVESVLICGSACLVGLGVSLLLSGSRQDFLSEATWTVLAYELRISPAILAAALGTSVLVGVAGALVPAVKGARTRIIEALRKA